MYIFVNALKNIVRNRGRNMIIGAIVFTIIITTVVALTINNTAEGMINDYKSKFGSEVTISPNMKKLLKNNPDAGFLVKPATITPAQYIAFGESDYLLSSDYRAYILCRGSNLKPVESKGNGLLDGAKIEMDRGPLGADGFRTNVKLLGNYFDEFSDGKRELYEGSLPEKEDECIISADLAKASGLKIGDTIDLEGRVLNADDSVGTLKYKVTIVGTYLDSTEEFEGFMIPDAANNRRNEILTNYATVVKLLQAGQMGIEITPKFYLKDPNMLADFADELYNKGLDNTYDVKTDEAGFQRIVGPVEGLKGISITFMGVVLVLGAIILALLSSLAIRERKYEIGVLRAMGMKKSKVALGLWSEMLIVTSVCLAIGLGSGSLLAQPVADVLLEKQAANYVAPQNEQLHAGPNISVKGEDGQELVTEDVEIPNLNISISLLTVSEIILIALLLTSVSGVTAIRKITKYEPIKILMERN